MDITYLPPAQFSTELVSRGSVAAGHALTEAEAALLSPDHPFLEHGTWQGFLACRGGRSIARLVASIDPRQAMNGHPVGAIGFIAGSDDADAFAALITSAERWLDEQGAQVVRCPVQLSTWFGHRAITDGFSEEGGSDAFFLEPRNRRSLLDIFGAAGYAAAHRATSHLVRNADAIAGCERGIQRMESAGFRDRPIDLARLGTELETLHELVSRIFPESWGYAPLSFAEFTASFRQAASSIDPGLVRIVESPGGEPVGFVYAYPDRIEASQSCAPEWSESERRFVLKTIGVLPELRRICPGLGSALTGIVHQLAEENGYPYGVHAFMAEGSYAQRTSARWGSRMRSYATFERNLP